jgi:3-hydroxybutyrate dehydrogenase
MENFQGKVALVTGSTSGIGLAVAKSLAEGGATLVINGLMDQNEGAALCNEVSNRYNVEVIFQSCDLRNPGQIENMIKVVEKRYGAIDILVNNAGIQHVSPITDFPVEKWNDMLAVNLSASFHTMRLAIPAMVEKGWGRIVNIASISGLRARANKPGYVATKHGLVGLTKSVALELADTNVTCNAICPGWVLTPLVQKQIDALAEREGLDNEAASQKLISLRQPSGRFVTTEEVGALCRYLCSSHAREIRGAAWVIDGGTTAL